MISLIRKLNYYGVLAMNRRNACYVMEYNPRGKYPLVDDKLKTKELAGKAGIPVPSLYGVVEFQRQIRALPKLLEQYPDFVVKPASGSGGDGVLVISGRVKNMFRKIDGEVLSVDDLAYHVSNILGGIYSLGGRDDKAIIEYRVIFDDVFKDISYLGVPDIRIIVFLGVPVMAMVRLPTRISDGKANLHQGAMGVGIDLASGMTLGGVWREQSLDEHPDTGASVSGVSIPNWRKIIELASGCFWLTGLGYIGVDVVLDKNKGPLLLELNARPGLSIQIANREGLRHRLELVEKNRELFVRPEDCIQFSRERFKAGTFQ